MIWTEWDPLEEIIVGVCPPEHFYDNFVKDDRCLPLLNTILKETREDLDNLSSMLEAMGIKVYRPNNLQFHPGIDISTFQIHNPMAPIIPRDQHLVYGNKIVQTYTSMPNRWLDSVAYYDIFAELFKHGLSWNSMPAPLLKNVDDQSELYKTDRLLWHTATMFKCGDALITNSKGPGSQLGLRWMADNYPDCKIIINENSIQNNFGHIDHGFFMTDDETVFAENKHWAPEILTKNKNVIYLHDVVESPILSEVNEEKDQYKTHGNFSFEHLNAWLTEWKGYWQNVAFDFNVLVVDNKNIIISTSQPRLQELLDKHGITCHVSSIRHNWFWEAGIHCLTLDVKRRGEKRSIINTIN
jgi:hypothetical protein